jgi:hypothetical protein
MTMPASATNEIGIVVYPGVQAALFTVLRICLGSPLALHSINSEMIDARFASRTGNPRIAAMPNFRAYMTATGAGAHSLGS